MSESIVSRPKCTMSTTHITRRNLLRLGAAGAAGLTLSSRWGAAGEVTGKRQPIRRYLYVSCPDGSEFGNGVTGGGVRVLDIDNGCTFVKRITSPTLLRLRGGNGPGTRGCCACGATKRLYVICNENNGWRPEHGQWNGKHTLVCIDLTNDEVLWERSELPGGDRLSVSHDGKLLLITSGWWNRNGFGLVDAASGEVVRWWGRSEGFRQTHHAVMSRTDSIGWVLEQGTGRLVQLDTRDMSLRVVQLKDDEGRPAKSGTAEFIVDPAERFAYVGGSQVPMKVDLRSGDAVSAEYAQSTPDWYGRSAHIVALSNDGRTLYAGDRTVKHQGGEIPYYEVIGAYDNTGPRPRFVRALKSESRKRKKWVQLTKAGDRIFCSNGDFWDAAENYLGHWVSETGKRMWGCKFCEVHFQDNEVVWGGQCYGNGS